MRYLGIEPKRLRVGVFDFTGCEGCELQLVNGEETLGAFLDAIEVVQFREASSEKGQDYTVAVVDGCISRADEEERLKGIRDNARFVVALGSCACFGGVNRMKNALAPGEANRVVYGDKPKDTLPVRSVKEVVPVDFEIPGCPVRKHEVERMLQHLLFGIPFNFPVYPVCVECKQRFTTCLVELGQLCLGPITRGGCNAPCPAGGLGCWGCRGPAAEPNYAAFLEQARNHGFSDEEIDERLAFFGGFEGVRCASI